MVSNKLAPARFWRFIPLLSALLMLLLLVVIDPLLAGAPLWNIYEEGFWVPLAFPWIPWVLCTIPALVAGYVGASRTLLAGLSLFSLAAGIIPAFIWTLLIIDVAPNADSLWVASVVALFSGIALAVLLIWIAARKVWRTAKDARVPQQEPRF